MADIGNYWTRSASRNINRRRLLRGTAAAGAGTAAFGLVGCGGGGDGKSDTNGNNSGKVAADATSTPTPPLPTQQPKKGGTYNVGATGAIAGVDPHNSVYNGAAIVPRAYNYLFRRKVAPEAAAAKGVVYDLAESHKLEADEVTYTFKLRQNVKIAPNKYGVPERALDSDDVKISFDRMADEKSGSNAFTFFHNWVATYDAPDKETFRLVTKKPYTWTDAAIGNNLYGAIVPKEWLVHPDLKKDAVGAGAMMLKSMTEGQSAQMDRNPNYYNTGLPYIDSWVIKLFSDQATYRTAFQANQIDVYGPTDRDESNELKNADKALVQYSDSSISFNSFWMNVKSKPWDDPRVRRAVSRAMNPKEYIDIIGHGVGEPIGPMTYAFPEALPKDELAKLQPFNVAEAKQLFQQAGVSSFKFQHPTASNIVDYVNIFVRQMQAAGVTATPEPLDAGTWLAGYYTSQHSASLSLNQQYETPDLALQWFRTGGITGNGHYETGWAFPELDEAIDKAAATMDAKERLQAYRDVQRTIISKDPAFLNFFGLRAEAIVKPYVKNYPAGLGSLGTAFHDLWLDKA